MSAPTSNEAFLHALSTFERQVGEATQYWFAAATINEVSIQNPRIAAAFQSTPLFWLTVRGGLEHQAIVAIGRIFGQRKANPVNIDLLMQTIYDHRETVFSKAAFKARKETGDPKRDGHVAELVRRVHRPKRADFRRLQDLVKKYRKIYEEQFEPIRNQHVAHTDQKTAEELAGMFAKTRIRDFERMLAFLNSLHDALWHMYHNGLRPTLRPNRSSVRALVKSKLGDLGRRTVQEDIVRQTRECLAIFARGHSLTS